LLALLDDIVQALSSAGVTAKDLTWVQYRDDFQPGARPIVQAPRVAWQFTLRAPLSKIKKTSASLLALQKSLAAGDSGISLALTPQNVQAAPPPDTCDYAKLMASARTQAQDLAPGASVQAPRST
jgi:hypothetical protein